MIEYPENNENFGIGGSKVGYDNIHEVKQGDRYYSIMEESYSKIYNNIMSRGKYKQTSDLLFQNMLNFEPRYFGDIVGSTYYMMPLPMGNRAQMLVEPTDIYSEAKSRMVFFMLEDGKKYVIDDINLQDCPPLLFDGYLYIQTEVDKRGNAIMTVYYEILDMYYGPNMVTPTSIGSSFPLIGPKTGGKWFYAKRYEVIKKLLVRSSMKSLNLNMSLIPIEFAKEVLSSVSVPSELVGKYPMGIIFAKEGGQYISRIPTNSLIRYNRDKDYDDLFQLVNYYKPVGKVPEFYNELFHTLGPKYQARSFLHSYLKFPELFQSRMTQYLRIPNVIDKRPYYGWSHSIKTILTGLRQDSYAIANIFKGNEPDIDDVLILFDEHNNTSRYVLYGENEVYTGTKNVLKADGIMEIFELPKIYTIAEYCSPETKVVLDIAYQRYFPKVEPLEPRRYSYRKKYSINITNGCPSVLWVVNIIKYGESTTKEDALLQYQQFPKYQYEIEYEPGYHERRSWAYYCFTRNPEDLFGINRDYGLNAENIDQLKAQLEYRLQRMCNLPIEFIESDYNRALMWLLKQQSV